MSDGMLAAITVVLCVAMIVAGFTFSTYHSRILSAEVQKTRAEEGHKFKFGITKEDNNEAK